MQVFCLELVSTGFFGERIGPSFVSEGAAMLRAALDDLQRIPDVLVSAVLDVGRQNLCDENANIDVTVSPAGGDLESLVSELASEADATLIIAPEFDGL